MNTHELVVAFLDTGCRAEQEAAAAAALSAQDAALEFARLQPVSREFRLPRCWRVIDAAHRMHTVGWPAGMTLDEHVDAIADRANVARAELHGWTRRSCWDHDGRWAQRVLDHVRERRQLYDLADQLEELIGAGEVSEVFDHLRVAA